MKLSSFHKSIGDHVELLTEYKISGFDKIYVSKVFTNTVVPNNVLTAPNVIYGGTGFFYDKAPNLPDEIEHAFPDYHLYDEWVETKLANGGRPRDYIYYTDYSIGFLTRGCFRKCEFCVNKKFDRCIQHSPLSEFLDLNRKKICFLDDNFFACQKWEDIIKDVLSANKRFQFKQGLDIRLLTDKKIHSIMSWNYDCALYFAFDNIEDKAIIQEKLSRIKELYPNSKKHLTFYVLCGYDRNGKWDDDFWIKDISDTFERIKILDQYGAYPYIMRYEKCYSSKYNGLYSAMAAWVNQPNIFKKFTFVEFCKCKGMGRKYAQYKRNFAQYLADGNNKGITWQSLDAFEKEQPDIVRFYFENRGSDYAGCG